MTAVNYMSQSFIKSGMLQVYLKNKTSTPLLNQDKYRLQNMLKCFFNDLLGLHWFFLNVSEIFVHITHNASIISFHQIFKCPFLFIKLCSNAESRVQIILWTFSSMYKIIFESFSNIIQMLTTLLPVFALQNHIFDHTKLTLRQKKKST